MMSRLRLVVVAFTLAVTVLGGALWVFMTLSDRAQSLRENERMAQDMAVLLEEHAKRTVEASTLTLMHVAGEVREHGLEAAARSDQVWEGLHAMAATLPAIAALAVADPDGRIVLSSLERVPPAASIAEREYFRAHRDEGTVDMIGPARVGRVSSRTVFTVSRRLAGPDGAFAGVVTASIDTQYFRNLYHALSLGRNGQGGEITIHRDDGTTLVHYPMTAPDLDRSAAGTPLFRTHLRNAPTGIVADAGADGIDRIVAYRRVPGLPLVVTAAVDLRTALEEWRSRTLWTAAFAGPALLSIAGFARLALRSIRRETDARRMLVEVNENLEQRVVQRTAELSAARDDAVRESQAKSHFLANVSHELRTPLNAIIGFSELMATGLPGPMTDKQRQYVDTIHKSGAHLLRIINDILDLSKISAERLELQEQEVEVEALVLASLDIARGRAVGGSLVLATEIEPGLPPFVGDELRLKQILINLLSNAIKYTPEPGTVTISARRGADGGLVLAVRDTGIGMDADEIPRALTMFGQLDNALTRTHEGTGIGLPIAKALTELHEGRLTIDSTPSEGTTVSLHFPRERLVEAVTA